MASFGEQLRRLRMRAGLGLRTFAELIAERTSTVSAIELGQRTPWHRADKLERVADVLGLVTSTPFCDDLFSMARNDIASAIGHHDLTASGTLAWWWTTDNAPVLDEPTVHEMADFLGAEASPTGTDNVVAWVEELTQYPVLTELAAEWRVRQLLGRRETPLAAAPVDVEAVLENQGNVRIEIIAGLVPRFSVQACAVTHRGTLTLLVDRIVADSRPLASYRELLARLYAPAALWVNVANSPIAGWFQQLQQHQDWSQLLRDCERFALSMLLPAGPVLDAAEVAYREVIEQQGWVDTDTAARSVRNRLAEQFAVPPLLVHIRLTRWPCHVYGRIAQALAAEELTLPPVDWFEEQPGAVKQGMLFETA
jgi:transcriptional regulator with XRE-family HTH domain